MDNATTPTNNQSIESLDNDQPMTHQEIEEAFETLSLFFHRINTLVQANMHLSEPTGMTYDLLCETEIVTQEAKKTANKYVSRALKGIIE
ncbi:hypothetical protein [Nitrosomonas sp. Is37]|uniref:hypothetical protein n=1 Tax=Nitrosomonas sp. Is37 TaxID=3080535 RepID=UPI00294B6B14|nr:hypothetical protein [Nitrosomonas sp. Is37]MDV6345635.1 hypothetical protein [Nitrosomonas sp. Is37]